MPFQMPTLTQQYLEDNGLLNPYNEIMNYRWLGQPSNPAMAQPEAAPEMPFQYDEQLAPPPPNMMAQPQLMQNPAVAGFVDQEQEQSQNPITQGIEAAKQAPLRSPIADRYAATAEQKREALGHALVAFAGQMGASQNRSQLGAMVEGLNPALNAMTAEKQRAMEHNKNVLMLERQAEESALDREYKTGMLDIHKKELDFKINRAKFSEMTPAEQARISGGFLNSYVKIQDAKRKELKERTEHIRGNSDKANQRRKDIEAEVNKRWEKSESALVKQMNKYGLSEADIIPDIASASGEDILVAGRQGDSIVVKVNGKDIVVNNANFDAQPEAVKAAVMNYKG